MPEFALRAAVQSRPSDRLGAVVHFAMTLAMLPGGDFVAAGILDLERGIESEAALLVSIGEPRLTRLGMVISSPSPNPEHRLYARLVETDRPSAHSRYNALIRRLVSFERAAECVRP